MKALTLTQPWASAVALGIKTIETRSWPTRYRGPLLIHAAKGFPGWAKDFAEAEWLEGRLPAVLPRGAILCEVALIDCRRTEEMGLEISALEKVYGDYTPGRWAWMFQPEALRVFQEPVLAKGALGLWEWETDETVRGA